MINDEKRYDFITNQIRFSNDKIFESFNLFIKLAIAIIGGLFYILVQENINVNIKVAIIKFSPWLFILVAFIIISLILINLRAWCGYRKAESELTYYKVPLPKGYRAYYYELIMILGIILFILLFIVFKNKYLLPAFSNV